MFALVRVGERRRARVKPLNEMDFSLVLPCPRSFDGPPFPGESHIPALILGILESCVIVLQHYLCEDTIPAAAIGLQDNTEKVSCGQCPLKQLYYQYVSHVI